MWYLLLLVPVLGFQINGDIPWVVAGGGSNIGDNKEPIAFQLALRDLQLDWYKVFGHPPNLLAFPSNVEGPAVYVGTI